jgi:hypothetical protein
MEVDNPISLEARIAANAVVTYADAVANNVATNGRLFSFMIFTACLAAMDRSSRASLSWPLSRLVCPSSSINCLKVAPA